MAATLQVTPGSVELELGATETLTASILSGSGEPIPGASATWSSVDPSVASVDEQGTISAQGVGQTRVAATFQALSDSVVVRVVGGNDFQ